MKKEDGWRNAKYGGIPCWFNIKDNTLIGKNSFYEFLVNILIWIDTNIVDVYSFLIKVELEDGDVIDDF